MFLSFYRVNVKIYIFDNYANWLRERQRLEPYVIRFCGSIPRVPHSILPESIKKVWAMWAICLRKNDPHLKCSQTISYGFCGQSYVLQLPTVKACYFNTLRGLWAILPALFLNPYGRFAIPYRFAYEYLY